MSTQALFMLVVLTDPLRPNFTFTTGQSITGTVGVAQTLQDFLALQLPAERWLNLGYTGTTAQRPNSWPQSVPFRGMEFYDTTLGAWIVFDGQVWRNASTGAGPV